MPLHEVSIIPEPGRKGHVISDDISDLKRCLEPKKVVAKVSPKVKVFLAGDLAESILTGKDMRRIGSDDWDTAKRFVKEVIPFTTKENETNIWPFFNKNLEQSKAMVTALHFQDLCGKSELEDAKFYLEANNLLTIFLLSEPRHWSVLRDLVEELIKHKHIDGEPACTFIKGRLEHHDANPEEAHAPNPEIVNRIEQEIRERIAGTLRAGLA